MKCNMRNIIGMVLYMCVSESLRRIQPGKSRANSEAVSFVHRERETAAILLCKAIFIVPLLPCPCGSLQDVGVREGKVLNIISCMAEIVIRTIKFIMLILANNTTPYRTHPAPQPKRNFLNPAPPHTPNRRLQPRRTVDWIQLHNASQALCMKNTSQKGKSNQSLFFLLLYAFAAPLPQNLPSLALVTNTALLNLFAAATAKWLLGCGQLGYPQRLPASPCHTAPPLISSKRCSGSVFSTEQTAL